MKFMQFTARNISSIQNDERNLPITIWNVEIGAVSKSCSVFVFFSSLKVLIVRTGRIIIITKSKNEKYIPVSEDFTKRVVTPSTIAESASATAKNM